MHRACESPRRMNPRSIVESAGHIQSNKVGGESIIIDSKVILKDRI